MTQILSNVEFFGLAPKIESFTQLFSTIEEFEDERLRNLIIRSVTIGLAAYNFELQALLDVTNDALMDALDDYDKLNEEKVANQKTTI